MVNELKMKKFLIKNIRTLDILFNPTYLCTTK